ncbi:trypsin-like serine protease [Sorangium sp. So ce1014]|uniref:hypothetical protein n=1 Tax=Sorangium sp. So ce1014 TaxID=3133326 RepID=UPI003F5E9C89
MDQGARSAIARITARKGGAGLSRGAGSLCDPALVLTALHVVADRKVDPVRFYSDIRVCFPTFETTAEVVDGAWDKDLDFVVLRLKEPCPESIRPLQLRRLADRDSPSFESFGFPGANPEGLAVTGKIIMARSEHENVPAIQLYCEQAGAGIGMQVEGLSGAPCLVGRALVGVLRRSLSREQDAGELVSVGGTLYASSISDILERTASLLPEPMPVIEADEPTHAAVLPYEPYLRSIPPNSQNWPSWKDIEHEALWIDEASVGKCEQSMLYGRLAVIVGPPGCGKTTVARLLAYRRSSTHFAVHWDFDNYGSALPEVPAHYLATVRKLASINQKTPLLVLENIHLAPRLVRELLGLCEQPMLLATAVLTSRVSPDRLTELSQVRSLLPRLASATVDLTTGMNHRGQAILTWWFERRGVSQQERRRILASAPWGDFARDLWVLRLALDAYDWSGHVLPAWAVHGELEKRLSPLIERVPGVDDLLYVIAAIGKHDLETDLKAAAAMLDRPQNSILDLAREAARDGILSLDERRGTTRYWHSSLARLYWETFSLSRDTWAQDARRHILTGRP